MHLINEAINNEIIRIVEFDGLEKMDHTLPEALSIAEENDLDLVKFSDAGDTAICKLINYSKFCYDEQKKLKKKLNSSKHKKATGLKEIKLGYKIEEHDLKIKAAQADRILKAGNNIKITMTFRGREMAYISLGQPMIKKLLAEIKEPYKESSETKIVGNSVYTVIYTTKK